jgi:hypothetical protein
MSAANDNETKAIFEVGKTYYARSLCDHDCVYRFEIMKRTEKSVWVKYFDRVTRRSIYRDYDGHEACNPHGTYSMSPILSANKEISTLKV